MARRQVLHIPDRLQPAGPVVTGIDETIKRRRTPLKGPQKPKPSVGPTNPKTVWTRVVVSRWYNARDASC